MSNVFKRISAIGLKSYFFLLMGRVYMLPVRCSILKNLANIEDFQ